MITISIVVPAIMGGSARQAFAGCKYDSSDGQHSALMSSAGHRNGDSSSFLDRQWVYEGGLIKFVPREQSTPCRGPLCRAGKELPSDNMSTTRDGGHNRLPVMHVEFSVDPEQDHCTASFSCAGVELSGYPSIPEHPPRF